MWTKYAAFCAFGHAKPKLTHIHIMDFFQKLLPSYTCYSAECFIKQWHLSLLFRIIGLILIHCLLIPAWYLIVYHSCFSISPVDGHSGCFVCFLFGGGGGYFVLFLVGFCHYKKCCSKYPHKHVHFCWGFYFWRINFWKWDY